MCDTFHLPSGDQLFFGKNSDRNPEEAQTVHLVTRREPADKVLVGGHSLDSPDAGHAMILSCPTWMDGAEMGLNDQGVAIGNEAVFARFAADPAGILGMDFLRATLMGAASAAEARDILVALTERHAQGGNGALRGRLVYNNSYFVVGPDGAFIVETAGRRWAWKAVEGPAAISNAYSIGADYKRLDAETRKAIAPVNERMACLDEADAGRLADKESWKAYVGRGFKARLMGRLTAGDSRRRALESAMGAAAETGGRQAAFALLRAHDLPDPHTGRPRHVCCHDRDLWGSATTGSMLVEREAGLPGRLVAWFSAASYPCANLYKPILFDGTFKPLWSGFSDQGDGYWQKRRTALRRVGRDKRASEGLAAELAATQARIGGIVDALPELADTSVLAEARQQVDQIVVEWDSRLI
jgi:hypothetical protein